MRYKNKQPTERQKRLAKVIMENEFLKVPLNKSEMLEKAGYSKESREGSAFRILKQEGVKQALGDLGFNEDSAKSVVVEIMEDKGERAETRLNAVREVFRVLGSYAPEKSSSMHLNLESKLKLENGEMKALRLEFEERVRNKLIGNENV